VLDGERSPRAVAEAVRQEIARQGRLQVDYIEVVDAETLEPGAPKGDRVLVAAAVYCGTTRLIDNNVIDVQSKE
jgi:pantothenate synthetase